MDKFMNELICWFSFTLEFELENIIDAIKCKIDI